MKKNKRLLVMCSSKNRPHLLKEMIWSFLATRSDGTYLVIYISETDKKKVEYLKLVDYFENFHLNLLNPKQNFIKFIFGEDRGNMVKVLNYLFETNPGYEYYSDINDDHIYRTLHWDDRLIKAIEEKGGWGIACGRDLVNSSWYDYQRPSAPVVSSNILNYLGYWMPPEFERIGCDDVHKEIGLITNLIHLDNVIIEHRCYNHVAKRPLDENDLEVYWDGNIAVQKGTELFQIWKYENRSMLADLHKTMQNDIKLHTEKYINSKK